jgi:osmotically-inducible protein OsmY
MTLTPPLDSDIFARARKALDDDPSIPQSVRVHVDCGTVTLTGTARSAQDRSQAEAVVRRIAGVGPIINHIVVAGAIDPETMEVPEFP